MGEDQVPRPCRSRREAGGRRGGTRLGGVADGYVGFG